jgi:head-tail adaptor
MSNTPTIPENLSDQSVCTAHAGISVRVTKEIEQAGAELCQAQAQVQLSLHIQAEIINICI